MLRHHLHLKCFVLACLLSSSIAWVDPDADLLSAADSGKIAEVKAALAQHANINALNEFGSTPLITAVVNADKLTYIPQLTKNILMFQRTIRLL